MTNYCNVSMERSNGAVVLVVTGELDLGSAGLLSQAFKSLADSGTKLVIADLRELEFIDSTGISLLVKAHRAAERDGTTFAVAGAKPQVTRLLSLTGLTDMLTIIGSPDELIGVG
jgi:anti-sigma B factor antagonist